jgi:uncharacterized membrane protein
MNFRKITRTHGMLVGFGAVLLLASFARAQQDMDPTPFDDTRSARSEEQTAPTKSAQHSEAANGRKATGAAPVVAQRDEDATQEARITQLTAPDIAVMLVLMIGIGIIVLYALEYRQFGGAGKTVRKR